MQQCLTLYIYKEKEISTTNTLPLVYNNVYMTMTRHNINKFLEMMFFENMFNLLVCAGILYPQGLSFEYVDRLVDGRHWAGGIRRFLQC
jgi:hypothetical protein